MITQNDLHIHKVSVVILYYNEPHIKLVLQSISAQTKLPDEVIIIDDHSNTLLNTNDIGSSLILRIHRNSTNKGRGYSRNLGLKLSKHDFVLFCDSSNSLCKTFIEESLNVLLNNDATAVFGRIVGDPQFINPLNKWRERNLFLQSHPKLSTPYEVNSLSSYSTLLKKANVEDVGSFNKDLVQYEDHELGERLLKNNFKILFHPTLYCVSNKNDNLFQLATRIDRWYSPTSQFFNLSSFYTLIKTSICIWIKRDFESKDYCGVIISLLIPYIVLYQNITYAFRKN
jgi:glycosyltransferase involved in cell wall biosynthesis